MGDHPASEARHERPTPIRSALAQLPDEDRIRTFDAYRTKLLALPAAIAVASSARREELCRIVPLARQVQSGVQHGWSLPVLVA